MPAASRLKMYTGSSKSLVFLRRRLTTALAAFLIFISMSAGCDNVVSDRAEARFKGRAGPFTVTVFPVQIISGSSITHDKKLAERLSGFLKQKKIAFPEVSGRPVEIPVYPGIAETKRIRISAGYLEKKVDFLDLSTEYASLAQIIRKPEKDRVLGVYFYLSDRFGRIASARMADSRHREFRRVNPLTPGEALPVLEQMILEGWM